MTTNILNVCKWCEAVKYLLANEPAIRIPGNRKACLGNARRRLRCRQFKSRSREEAISGLDRSIFPLSMPLDIFHLRSTKYFTFG